jgi:hypothetical protein
MAGLSGGAGASSEIDFRERCHGEIDCAIEILARVAAQVGEPDRTIAALQKLSRSLMKGRWLQVCRSLLRCSRSIPCSIRSEIIRVSKNSSSHPDRSRPINKATLARAPRLRCPRHRKRESQRRLSIRFNTVTRRRNFLLRSNFRLEVSDCALQPERKPSAWCHTDGFRPSRRWRANNLFIC